jgi:peptide/nickel transport system substrate-binding protein
MEAKLMSSYWQETLRRRVSRRRALAATGATAAAAAFLAACGGGDDGGESGDSSGLISKPVDTTKQAKRGGVSKFYFGSEPNHLDVQIVLNPLSPMKNFVYSNLVTYEPGFMEPPNYDNVLPDLAESWEWSGDRLQLTMKLRQGVTWHNKPPVNGRALSVDDVVFTWDRWSRIGNDRASLANVANPNAPVLSVTATDARTIVIKLKEPLVYLMQSLARHTAGWLGIVPKETESGFDIRRDMIGTGPFILDSYTPSSSFTFKRNPQYYDKTLPYVDQIDAPIITEYAQGVAQFKAGNIYTYAVRAEDLLQMKRDIPAVKLFQSFPSGFNAGLTLGLGFLPGSIFNDERVRQAVSLSFDRDLYLDTFNNVSAFEAEGLPVDTFWFTSINAAPGWWLDPKDEKEFGPNAKYYSYDVAEAKRLLAAAGYPNGVDVTSTVISGTQIAGAGDRGIEVRESMARDAGFRPQTNIIDYTTEYLPKYRDGQGKFEGWAYRSGVAAAMDAVAYYEWRFFSKGGVGFLGFDAAGKGDASGDPYVDDLIVRARSEVDTEKRRSMVFDLQRHLAKAMYCVLPAGTGTGFDIAWPVLGNFYVFQGDRRGDNYTWWIDDSQPPIKTA